MLEKGFLRNQPDDKRKHHHVASMVSKSLLYLGTIILIVSFVYLLIHIDQADSVMGLVLPVFATGLGLIFVSLFVKRAQSKLRQ